MFFTPIRITVWSGFAGWNHMKTNLRAWGAGELQKHVFFSATLTDHTLIPLCCLCKSHVAALISILLLGSGWTWSSLVVYINSDSEDYRVYAAMLRGSEGDTVTKPSEQTGLNQIYCMCALHCLTFPSPRCSQRELWWTPGAVIKGNDSSNHPVEGAHMSALNKLPRLCCRVYRLLNALYIWKNLHHAVSSDNPAWRLKDI